MSDLHCLRIRSGLMAVCCTLLLCPDASMFARWGKTKRLFAELQSLVRQGLLNSTCCAAPIWQRLLDVSAFLTGGTAPPSAAQAALSATKSCLASSSLPSSESFLALLTRRHLPTVVLPAPLYLLYLVGCRTAITALTSLHRVSALR